MSTPANPAPEPTPPASTAPETPPAAAVTPPAEPKPTPPPAKSENVWDDPEAAKAEIDRLRRENAASRTNAKAQAAEEARNELAQTIGKALGLVEDEQIDPAKLADQVQASQAATRRAQVELAVFRIAAEAGGDPVALLDSASFLASLDQVDPADAAALKAAVETAVTSNPRLAATPGDPRPPAPNPAQGSSGSGPSTPGQLSESDLTSMTPDQIVSAQNEGRLNALLGRR